MVELLLMQRTLQVYVAVPEFIQHRRREHRGCLQAARQSSPCQGDGQRLEKSSTRNGTRCHRRPPKSTTWKSNSTRMHRIRMNTPLTTRFADTPELGA